MVALAYCLVPVLLIRLQAVTVDLKGSTPGL